MGRPCTVCHHGQVGAIDKALVGGEPYRYIAQRFATSVAALQRHRTRHLRDLLARARRKQERAQDTHSAAVVARVEAQEQKTVEQALDVVAQLKAINGVSLQILQDARRDGDGTLALKAIDRVQRQIELQAKLLGELDDRPQVNVLLAPEWLTVRTALLSALAPYGEARAAVAQQLLSLEAAHGHSG